MKATERKNKKNMYNALLIVLIGVCFISVSLTVMQIMASKPWEAKAIYDHAAEVGVTQGETYVIPYNPRPAESDGPTGSIEPEETPSAGPVETIAAGKDDSVPATEAASTPSYTETTYTAKPTAKPTAKGSPTPKPTPDYTVNTISVDFSALHNINSDIVCWLYLEGTQISYPVVETNLERGPDYYLKHAYDLTEHRAGALYISSIYEAFSTENTIIHGHRMNNGTMFGTLYKFKKYSYFAEHPVFQLYTPDKGYYVYVFSAYETDIDGGYYKESFETEDEYLDYIYQCIRDSEVSTGVVPTAQDKIITLSTCVVNKDTKRFVLHGLLIEMG